MSDDYQLRKDIDKFKKFLNDLQALMDSKGIEDLDIQSLLSQYYDMSEVDISNSEINNRIDELDNKISNVDININTKLSQLLMPNIDVTEVAYLIGNGVDTEQLNQLTENGYDISTIQYVYNSAGETYYLDNGVWSLLDEFPSWLSDPVMGIKLDMIPNVDKGGVAYNSEPFQYIFSVSDGKYWIHFEDAFYEMGDLNSFFQFTELYKVIKYLFDEDIPINYVVISTNNTLTEDVSTFIVGKEYYFVIRAFKGSSEIYVNDIRCKIEYSGAIDELTLVNSDDWSKVFKFTPMEQKGHVLRVYRSDTLVATYTFDAIIDTGWQNVSFSAGYTNYPNDSLKIRRIGNIVEINGSWTVLANKTASTKPIKFATIDEMFRPVSEVYVRQQGRDMNTYLLLVEPNGNVYWSKYGTSSSLELPASAKCICHALWTVNGGAVGGGSGGGSTDVSWGNILNKPSTFPPSIHNHDDRYYTESEIDAALSNKVSKSSTSGLLKNDGSVDTNAYITSSAISGKEDTSNKVSSWSSTTDDTHYPTEKLVKDSLDSKQATLVSGTNIKTINNTSLLGSGNISIQGGGSVIVDNALSITSENPVQNKVITGALNGKADSSSLSTVATSGSYTDLSNKPSTFPPSNHTHLSSDVTDLIDVIYPVGSIYMSVNSTSPQTLFGGTWEQIKDTFLLSSGDTYANGSTGGSADAVIISHSHKSSANGEYIVTSEENTANNTKVAYSANGNRWVDGQPSQSHFHHRTSTSTVGEDGTGKNMPPYLAVNIWKRIE